MRYWVLMSCGRLRDLIIDCQGYRYSFSCFLLIQIRNTVFGLRFWSIACYNYSFPCLGLSSLFDFLCWISTFCYLFSSWGGLFRYPCRQCPSLCLLVIFTFPFHVVSFWLSFSGRFNSFWYHLSSLSHALILRYFAFLPPSRETRVRNICPCASSSWWYSCNKSPGPICAVSQCSQT